MSAGVIMNACVRLPQDKWTSRILGIGVSAYLMDVWSPIPIGESILATSFAVAYTRGKLLEKSNRQKYDHQARVQAIKALSANP